MPYNFSLTQLLDKGSELFQDSVFNHEVLDQYYRGFLSESELIERIKFYKVEAEQLAPRFLQREAEDRASDVEDPREESA